MILRAALVAMALSAGCPAVAEPVLPGADGSVCDFVAANAGKHLAVPKSDALRASDFDFSDFLFKNAIADVDGDGDNEMLATYYTNDYSTTVVGLKAGYGYSRDLPPAADPKDLMRWTKSGRWLHFGDEWYDVEFADRDLKQVVYVITYGKTGEHYSCTFLPRFEEAVLRYDKDPAVATAYDAIRLQSVAETFSKKAGGQPLTANDRRYLLGLESGFKDFGDQLRGLPGAMREVGIDGAHSVVIADFDRDGIPERFVRLGLQSGAGGGCGAVWVELLPDEGQVAPDAAKRASLLSREGVDYGPGKRFPITCGAVRDVINVNGKGYLYSAEADFGITARKLEETRDGHLYPVIQSVFTAEHEVVFDSSKGGLIKKGKK
jgi:hypothetical protein